jgi:hypothetical protein
MNAADRKEHGNDFGERTGLQESERRWRAKIRQINFLSFNGELIDEFRRPCRGENSLRVTVPGMLSPANFQ